MLLLCQYLLVQHLAWIGNSRDCGVVLLWLWDCELCDSRSLNILLMITRVAAAEGYFIWQADWDQAVEDAQMRNNAG